MTTGKDSGAVGTMTAEERSRELAANLAEVGQRITRAVADAGRDPGDVTLVVVTKTWPARDTRLLAGLGVRDVGESRDQEACAKVDDCAGLDLVWHFVGRLQTNKAGSVARYADVVHSVDRTRVVTALDRAAQQHERTVTCLVQVDLDQAPDPGRGGVQEAAVPALADAVAATQGLRLGGVMAVAPRDGDPRVAFERLARIAERLRRDHPGATVVSAGMSGDLEEAVASGATHLRVGTAVLGSRPPLR